MREIVVDLDAIRDNVRTIKARIAPARLMAVVKADAYGHGAVPVARAMAEAGADEFGVADIEEARRLRLAGIGEPILAWLHGRDADFGWAIAAGVELGVGAVEQLDRIALAAAEVRALAERAGSPLPQAVVHLKTDTGLGRGGAVGKEWRRLVEQAVRHSLEGRVHVRGVWTHMANASVRADAEQFRAFDEALAVARESGLTPEVEHLESSASLETHPDQRRGMVRVGLSLYGLSTFDDRTPAELGLRPAMEFGGEVIAVKRVPAGHGVSYGHRHVTERETTLALVPVGYAEGLPRAATGIPPVSLNGQRYVVAGTIAMDQVVIDVGDDPVELGDRAVFWGDPAAGHPGASEWAAAAGTIPYEIVTRVGPRMRRRYLG